MIKLHFTAGPLAGTTSELNADFISLGRELDNVMTIPDGKLSRYHFCINRTPSGYELLDNKSTNGTFLNGQKLAEPTALQSGDEVSAGNTAFRVEFASQTSTIDDLLGRFYVQSPEGSFETEGDFITIGRSPENHVHIDDSFISREHTHILYRDKHFYLKDNGSYNGTFINNERIVEQQLKDGDKAQYGGFVVEFQKPAPNFLRVLVSTRSVEDEYGVAAANAMQDLSNTMPQALAEFDLPKTSEDKVQAFIPKDAAAIDARYATMFVDDIPKAVLESTKDKQKKRLNWEPTSDVIKDNRNQLYVGGSVAAVLVVVLAMFLTGFHRPFMNRPLSAAHQSEPFPKYAKEMGFGDCDACHTTFRGVSTKKCNDCHKIQWTPFGELHQSKAFEAQANERGHEATCAVCHSEHRGEDKSPLEVAEGLCVECHTNTNKESAPGYHDKDTPKTPETKIPRSKETKKAPTISAKNTLPLAKLHAKHANLDGYCVACHAPRPTQTIEGEPGPALERPSRACLDCHQVESSSTCIGCHEQHPGSAEPVKATGSTSFAPLGGFFLVLFFFAPAFVVFWQKKKRNELLPINPVRAKELLLQAKLISNEPREKFTVIIKKDLCIGCSGCINSCPYEVLELDETTHKSIVVRPEQCLGDLRCTKACPTGACVVIQGDKIPEVDRVKIDEFHQTNIEGLYVIGEASGKPLIKNAINQGKIAIDHIASQLLSVSPVLAAGQAAGSSNREQSLDSRLRGNDSQSDTIIYDVIVVGSGPGGISAALAAQEQGLKYLLLEKALDPSDTIRNFPKAKIVLAEPVSIPLAGKLWMEDTNKETLIAKWEEIILRTKLQVTLNQEVLDLTKSEQVFTVQTNKQSYKGRRVILAPGTRGAPNKIGCPGEDALHPTTQKPRVAYMLADADLYRGKSCAILGGGDSAIEAALALADAGATVTLAYRREKFERVKQRNIERFTEYVKQKKIKLYLLAVCKEISPGAIVIKHERGLFEVKGDAFSAKGKPGEEKLNNDFIFALLGAQAPEAFFKKCGIQTHKVPMA